MPASDSRLPSPMTDDPRVQSLAPTTVRTSTLTPATVRVSRVVADGNDRLRCIEQTSGNDE